MGILILTSFESRSVTEVGSEHLLDELWPQIRPLIQKMVAERFVSEIWPQIEHLSRQQVFSSFLSCLLLHPSNLRL